MAGLMCPFPLCVYESHVVEQLSNHLLNEHTNKKSKLSEEGKVLTEILFAKRLISKKQIFICCICKFRSANEKSLHKHMTERHRHLLEEIGSDNDNHQDSKDFDTSMPGSSFSNATDFCQAFLGNSSLPGTPKIKELYECDKCPETFTVKTPYMSHMKQHERQKLKYLETTGDAGTMGYLKSKYSNISIFPEGEGEEVEESKRFICKICQSGFPTKPLFSAHFDEVHSKDYPLKVRKRRSRDAPPKEPKPKKNRENTIAHNYIRLYVCDTGCGHEFSTVPQLVDHMTEEHQEMVERISELIADGKKAACVYECKHCKFRSKLQPCLWVHVKRFHCTQMDFKCVQCNRFYPTSDSLMIHIKKDHERNHEDFDMMPKYTCEHCNFQTNFRKSLARHIRTIHLNRKLYSCKDCDKKFTNRHNFVKHTTKFHFGEQSWLETAKT